MVIDDKKVDILPCSLKLHSITRKIDFFFIIEVKRKYIKHGLKNKCKRFGNLFLVDFPWKGHSQVGRQNHNWYQHSKDNAKLREQSVGIWRTQQGIQSCGRESRILLAWDPQQRQHLATSGSPPCGTSGSLSLKTGVAEVGRAGSVTCEL